MKETWTHTKWLESSRPAGKDLGIDTGWLAKLMSSVRAPIFFYLLKYFFVLSVA